VVGILNEVAEETGGVQKLTFRNGFVVVQVQGKEGQEILFHHGSNSFFEVEDQLATDFHHVGGSSTDFGESLLKSLFIFFIHVNVLIA